MPGGSCPAVGGPGLCSHDQIQGPGKEASKAGRGLSDETEDTEFRHFTLRSTCQGLWDLELVYFLNSEF